MSSRPIVERMEAWITPVFMTSFSGHETYCLQLREALYRHREQAQESVASGIACIAKQGLYESTFDFLEQQDVAIAELKLELADLVLLAAQDANQMSWPEGAEARAIITESWCHITQNGGFHDVHSHPNCSWCGIYYLDAGDCDFAARNGVNRFYDPRHNAEHYLDAGSSYLNAEGVLDIEPQAGQVIIFPSYLKHSALPYFGCKDRLVIAFNAQVHFVD